MSRIYYVKVKVILCQGQDYIMTRSRIYYVKVRLYYVKVKVILCQGKVIL